MIDFQDINERNRIKSVVAAREIEGIQIAIDNKDFVLKSYPTKAVNTDKHEIGFVITRDSVDRDGERILPSAFKKDFDYFLDNPVVLYNHNMREPAVGQMVKHKITDAEIQMWVKFAVDENPMAAMLWKLYSADPPYMRMTSPGFIPLEASNDEKMKLPGQKNLTYTRVEMIELSLANIGANRHATSMLPKDIRNDPTLKKEFERAVEETPAIPGVIQAFEPEVLKVSDKRVHVNIGDDDNPIILSLSTSSESELNTAKEESMSNEKEKAAKAASAEKETANPNGTRIVVLHKDMNLADTLNTLIGDGDDRDDAINSIATQAGIEIKSVKAILDGTLASPDTSVIEGIAKALAVDTEILTKAAADDETETPEAESVKTKALVAEAENLKQKYYGYMESMRPTGSFEEVKSKIYRELENYLFKNVPDIEIYDWMDFEIVGSYPQDSNIVVCVFNREFKAAYQINYSTDGDKVMLGEMTEVRLGFEPV